MSAKLSCAARACCIAWSVVLATAQMAPIASAATVSVTLRWTAPGDDGHVGRASLYELRYLGAPITDANVLTTPRILGLRPPSAAGQRDSMTISVPVTGLPTYFVLRTADEAGNWSRVSNNAVLPGTTAELPDTLGGLALAAPSPNPARAMTTLSFTTPRDAEANVDVFDTSGRRVRALVDGVIGRGRHSLRWDLRDQLQNAVPAGLYLVRARVGAWESRQRVAVVR